MPIPVDDIETIYAESSVEQREHVTSLLSGSSHVCVSRVFESDETIISVDVKEQQLPRVFDSVFSTMFLLFGVHGTFDQLRKSTEFVSALRTYHWKDGKL